MDWDSIPLQETRLVTTADSGEPLAAPVLIDYHRNSGWDWLEDIDETGWHPVGTWGVDGYDLGDWPLVIIVVRNLRHAGRLYYGLGTYCEGDVTTRWFRDRVERWEAITAEAFWWWKSGQSDGPKGLPETAAELPIELRRPPGWHEGMTPDERRREPNEEQEG
jgi:hypothetical protein